MVTTAARLSPPGEGAGRDEPEWPHTDMDSRVPFCGGLGRGLTSLRGSLRPRSEFLGLLTKEVKSGIEALDPSTGMMWGLWEVVGDRVLSPFPLGVPLGVPKDGARSGEVLRGAGVNTKGSCTVTLLRVYTHHRLCLVVCAYTMHALPLAHVQCTLLGGVSRTERTPGCQCSHM